MTKLHGRGAYVPPRGGFSPQLSQRQQDGTSRYQTETSLHPRRSKVRKPLPCLAPIPPKYFYAKRKGLDIAADKMLRERRHEDGRGRRIGVATAVVTAAMFAAMADMSMNAAAQSDVQYAPDNLCEPDFQFIQGKTYRIDYRANLDANHPADFGRDITKNGFAIGQSCERLDENGNADFYRGLLMYFYRDRTEDYGYANENLFNNGHGVPGGVKFDARYTGDMHGPPFPERPNLEFDVLEVHHPQKTNDPPYALIAAGAATFVGLTYALNRIRKRSKRQEIVGRAKDGKPVYGR